MHLVFPCTIPFLDLLLGLTIGLMGLDETNLHVLMASGSPTEQVHAETVYSLLSRGKHWVLGTVQHTNTTAMTCFVIVHLCHAILMDLSFSIVTHHSDTLAWKCHCERDIARGSGL